MPKRSFFRYPLLLFLIVIYVLIGSLRYDFIINVINRDLPFLIHRSKIPDLENYPLKLKSLGPSLIEDPRWFSSILYTIFSISLTAGIIYLLFLKKSYVGITLLTYGLLIVALASFISFSFFTGAYKHGYGIGQKIKNLIQEPFFVFFLTATFIFIKRMKKET